MMPSSNTNGPDILTAGGGGAVVRRERRGRRVGPGERRGNRKERRYWRRKCHSVPRAVRKQDTHSHNVEARLCASVQDTQAQT
eukprot:2070022-Rhodomonas_salina.2